MGDTSLGLEKQGRAMEVKILQTHRPRTPEPSVTREPKMSRTHVGDGESGVEILKRHETGHLHPHYSLTGEGGVARPACGGVSQLGPVLGWLR